VQSMTLEQLRATALAGGVMGVTLKGLGRSFIMEIATKTGQGAVLAKSRTLEPRRFGNPVSALAILRDLGIAIVQLDAIDWDPASKDTTDNRPSHAETANYNQWLAQEVQASLNDPRPNIPDSDVMTEIDALLAALPH